MKVAVVPGAFAPRAGGGFTFQDDIVQALLDCAPASQHEFVLVGSFSPEFREAVGSRPSISLLEVGRPRLQRVERLAASMSQGALSVLHAAGVRSSLDRQLLRRGVQFVWFATQYVYFTELPYIYTLWDLQHRRQPWFPEFSGAGRWLHREREFSFAIQRATLVITPNRAGQKEIETYYGVFPERIRCYAHPTPAFALRAAELPRPPPPASVRDLDEYILYPAQFWAHKNHVAILRAVHALASRGGPRLKAVFVGRDGGNLAHVQGEARRLGLADRVRFLGFVEREELIALYRNALALVFPSFCGPENLPPLEAFAFGCPVIASRVDGAEEQLGNAALLFDPADHAALGRAMEAVATDAELRKGLIARGRERATSWTARQYVASVLRDLDEFSTVRACWP